MKWIVKKTGKYILPLGLLCAFIAVLTFAGVVQALAMRNFLDYAAAGDKAGFLRWFAMFFGLIFFQLFGGSVRNVWSQGLSASLYNKFVADSFSTILTRNYAELYGTHSGEFMQRITGDTSVVTGSVIGIPVEICSLVTQLIAASWCLAWLQGKLALLLLGCFVLMLVVGLPLKKFVQKYHMQVMEAQGRVRSVLQEALDNLLILRSFQAVRGVQQQAREHMDTYRRIILRKTVFSQIMGSGGITAINFAYVLGMLWCGLGIVGGTVSFGTFSAVWQLIGQITGPAMQVTGILPRYYAMTASAQRLQELEKMEPEAVDASVDWQRVKENFDRICCKDVSFAYGKDGEGSPILQNLDFTINRGDFIAITGTSGIGKSTFLKLLLGIYPPASGTVAVCGGETAIKLDAGARNIISYVPQGNFLMSGTIRHAVHFWQGEQVDEDRLRQACRLAQADFIDNLEQGFDTLLAERGAGLSEGQLQRLAIARAIYSEKPVLLLDEATSALDEQTEAKVLENLRSLRNRTVIIVTHRKAALDICNRIVEMDAGRILEHHGNE